MTGSAPAKPGDAAAHAHCEGSLHCSTLHEYTFFPRKLSSTQETASKRRLTAPPALQVQWRVHTLSQCPPLQAVLPAIRRASITATTWPMCCQKKPCQPWRTVPARQLRAWDMDADSRQEPCRHAEGVAGNRVQAEHPCRGPSPIRAPPGMCASSWVAARLGVMLDE